MTDELEMRISLKMESGIPYDLALQQALQEASDRARKALADMRDDAKRKRGEK